MFLNLAICVFFLRGSVYQLDATGWSLEINSVATVPGTSHMLLPSRRSKSMRPTGKASASYGWCWLLFIGDSRGISMDSSTQITQYWGIVWECVRLSWIAIFKLLNKSGIIMEYRWLEYSIYESSRGYLYSSKKVGDSHDPWTGAMDLTGDRPKSSLQCVGRQRLRMVISFRYHRKGI